jgi:hypothetical protein
MAFYSVEGTVSLHVTDMTAIGDRHLDLGVFPHSIRRVVNPRPIADPPTASEKLACIGSERIHHFNREARTALFLFGDLPQSSRL